MNKIIGVIILISLFISVDAQDSTPNLSGKQKLKAGIYRTEKEFLNNAPSITDSFTYKTVKEFSTERDTVILSLGYRFVDNTVEVRHDYGFCDGEETFIKVKGYAKNGSIRNTYFKVTRIGKYPFVGVVYYEKYKYYRGDLSLLAINSLNNPYGDDRVLLYYFDSNGRWLVTQPQLLHLLKSEPDLYNQFNNEKEMNYHTFKKYLIKINERHPF